MDESAAQPRSLKLTFKIKRDKIVSNCSTTADHPTNVGGEHNVLDGSPLPVSAEATSQEHLDLNAEVVENGTENEENPSSGNSQYQLVLYDPTVNGDEADPERIGYRAPRSHPFSNQAQRVLPSVGAFTVQCANCFKWRLIPTKEKYEELREHIVEKPFLCEIAREWRPDI